MRWTIFISIFCVFSLFVGAVHAQQTPQRISTKNVTDAAFANAFSDAFADEDSAPLISDPFETMNRGTFWFNDKLYFYFLKPVARVYSIVPRPARTSVGNFFSNLSSPVRVINSVLQLKLDDAGREISRFFINSIIGLGGLFDVADKWAKIPQKKEDFGQTLGFYHLGQGPYLILPFLGPSSLRDAGGTLVDTAFLDPFTLHLTQNWNLTEKTGLRVGQAINYLSLDDDSYEKIKRDSLDPYLFMRAAYAQYRLAKVAQ
ncbi:MlaA family lipoprotein [Geopsychrobacter electrodiphilus]|uniref:MlaA family lipoprotein n=1 Tax=Geopsychrobacter electrodiphilus TaxID=225196 RepID=UPI0012EC910E|nr:VacJ family lipoprotein [Geopsychrobacter electrodiphilus]